MNWNDLPYAQAGVGDTTDNNGEIFNDYENNKAISNNSHAEGQAVIAGSRAFNILEYKVPIEGSFLGGYILDSVEGIEVGDTYSIKINNNYNSYGIVNSIDSASSTVELTNCPTEALVIDSGGNVSQGTLANSFRIDNKPEIGTKDFGVGAHGEGRDTKATGDGSHAEGYATFALGRYAHAEGNGTIAHHAAHSEGEDTIASGNDAHAEGYLTKASGLASHAENWKTESSGEQSHAEGVGSIASGKGSHAQGGVTQATNDWSHSEGYQTISSGVATHTEGLNTRASAEGAHAEGSNTKAMKAHAHSEGANTFAEGDQSHAEGLNTKAIGARGHSEGNSSIAKGNDSHSEGLKTVAIGTQSHSEGRSEDSSTALVHSASKSDIETAWFNTNPPKNFNAAFGIGSHTEGANTLASGNYAHSEGLKNLASGNQSHAEGYDTQAKGDGSHTEGLRTIARGVWSHVQGKYNEEDTSNTYAHIVGNGTSETDRKNIHTTDWNGNAWYAGTVKVGGTSEADAKELATKEYVENLNAKVTEIIDSAPDALNTLKELADAIDNDANFASTVVSKIEDKPGNKTENNGEIFNDYENNKAIGNNSHAEGSNSTASGEYAHAEGWYSHAEGGAAHAEGHNANASGDYSHAEGSNSTASGDYSHAEGDQSTASGNSAHAEGYHTNASGNYSHAEGYETQIKSNGSHAEGLRTIASSAYTHVQGKYNEEDTSNKYAHIVGGGSSETDRKNIHTIDWNGNAWFSGMISSNIFETKLFDLPANGSTKEFDDWLKKDGILNNKPKNYIVFLRANSSATNTKTYLFFYNCYNESSGVCSYTWIDTYTCSIKQKSATIQNWDTTEWKNINKNFIVKEKLLVNNWDNNFYYFENIYNPNKYDIEISIDGDQCTLEQKKAFDKANMVGLSDNTIRALGTIPSIDIPIVMKISLKEV